jgi:hypothetical protein
MSTSLPIIRSWNDLSITWTIYKQNTSTAEDFSGATVKLFLVSPYEKILVSDFTLTNNVIAFTVSGNTLRKQSIYGFELVWSKNSEKNWSRVTKQQVFMVDDDLDLAYTTEISLSDITVGVGYDGLSAYESAVIGGYTGTTSQFYSILGNIGNTYSVVKVTTLPTNGAINTVYLLAVKSTSGVIMRYDGYVWESNSFIPIGEETTGLQTIYVNKYISGGYVDFIYMESAGTRGANVVIPIKNSDGTLKDMSSLICKVGFWLSGIISVGGLSINPTSIANDGVVLQCICNGGTAYIPLKFAPTVKCRVKDLFGKQIEVLFDSNQSWVAAVINGTPESDTSTGGNTTSSEDETETVNPFDLQDYTYEVSSATKNYLNINSTVSGGIVLLPYLSLSKTIIITVIEGSNDIVLDSGDSQETYSPGDVISASYNVSNSSWTIVKLSETIITDYSSVSVSMAATKENAAAEYSGGLLYRQSQSYGGQTSALGELVAIFNDEDVSLCGIFKVMGKQSTAVDVLQLLCKITVPNIIRVNSGTASGMWENLYDGKNDSSASFVKMKDFDQEIGDIESALSSINTILESI